DDWDVEERCRGMLDRLGLGEVGVERRLGALSGGEVVAVVLAARLLRRPEVLLLDGTTHDLDADARRLIHAALDDYPGTLLVVSHDRVLLDRMERIAELYRGEMLFYGGNFTTYQRQLAADQQSARNDVRHAEQSLRREKRER